jgi:hypothetical protein
VVFGSGIAYINGFGGIAAKQTAEEKQAKKDETRQTAPVTLRQNSSLGQSPAC